MNMKKVVLAISTLFYMQITGVKSQTTVASNNVLPNLIPPTPEAASFQKFGNNKINLSTGTNTYTVPLFNIKTGDFDLPLSISYSSNGVKVDEVASRVGMQWKIDFGGAITRTINGLPDEINNGGGKFITNDSLSSNAYLRLLNITSEPNQQSYMPDIYSYNAPGLSGKFYILKRVNLPDTIINIQHNNNKIELNINGGIRITNSSGIEYYFGQNNAVDQMLPFSQIQENTGFKTSENNAINAQYLTKIKLTNGKSIDFEYESLNNLGQPISYISGISQTYNNHSFFHPLVTLLYNLEPMTTATINEYYSAVVKKINFDGGFFEMYYSNREDIINEKKLDSVKLFSNGTLISSSRLSYIYSNHTSTLFDSRNLYNGVLSYQNMFPELRKRLFLQSVNNLNGNNNAVYSFEYNDINGLPPRLSFAQDYWGYFNGVSNQNDLFVPAYTVMMYHNIGGEEFGADRRANFDASRKGILTRINYPTGGYSNYEYEPSDSMISWKPIYQVSNFSSNITPTNYTYNSPVVNTLGAIYINKVEFTPSSVSFVQNPPGSPQLPVPDSMVFLRLKDQYGNIVWEKHTTINQPIIEKRLRIINEQLNYYFEVTSQYNQPINFQIKYSKKTAEQQPKSPACGLRVKAVVDYDNFNNMTNTRKFKYEYFNTVNNYLSTNYPNSLNGGFCYYEVNYGPTSQPVGTGPGYILGKLTSNSQNPLYNHDLGNRSFDMVTEEFYDKNNQLTGGIETKFNLIPKEQPKNFQDEPLINNISFFENLTLAYRNNCTVTYDDTTFIKGIQLFGTPFTNTDLNSGKESEINSFIIGSASTKVYKSKKRFVYSIDNRKQSVNRFVNIKKDGDPCTTLYKWFINFTLNKYQIISNWHHLDSVIEKTYDDFGNEMVNYTAYTYENDLHMQPTTVTKRNSKNEILRQRSLYNADLITNSINQQMVNKNILTSPILVVDSNITKNQFLASLRTEYNNYNSNYKPQYVYKRTTNANEELAIEFSSYDSEGNITTIQNQMIYQNAIFMDIKINMLLQKLLVYLMLLH